MHQASTSGRQGYRSHLLATTITRHTGEYEVTGSSRDAVELDVDLIASGIHSGQYPSKSPLIQRPDGIWIQWVNFLAV